ncbi:E3 ubiquitin-protein ligase RNF14-like protein [Leptotrombidium deliense]|uniref:E3 ubiquitin-protein ligase RNF14-like protein n=1 Tax=Leptotrombidium deliense TaxID=299467 RepID=A0A443SJ67_9ACAR|nr:E3 ubiquitin-protein ligase RNF14-like protein [Leptotrombidium deliense]
MASRQSSLGHNNASDDSVSNVIYFKGFAGNTSEETILSIFGKYGTVNGIHFGKDTAGVFLGHGTVAYEAELVASKAIRETSGMFVCGRKITVEQFVPKKDRDFKNVFVKNFKDEIANEEELTRMFQRYGEIISVKVERNPRGECKGYGYVCFANAADARMAVDLMNGYEFRSGKILFVAKHESKSARNYNRSHSVSIPQPAASMHRIPFNSVPSHFAMPFTQTANFSTYHPYVGSGNVDRFCNVFVKNFSGVIENEIELCTLFHMFGPISSAKVMKDERNRSRGCGFVRFYSSFSAKRAVEEMNGRNFHGKFLYVGKAMNKIERQVELRRSFHSLLFGASQFTPFNRRHRRSIGQRRQGIQIESILSTECNICFSEHNAAECVLLNCKHVICKECIVFYIQHAVKSRDIDAILCPKNECDEDLTFDLIRELIPRELHDEYLKCLCESYLNKSEDIIWCPKAECRSPLYMTSNLSSIGQCPQCNFIFCTKCGEKYHGINACSEFESENQRMEILSCYMNGTETEKKGLIKRYTKKKLDKEVEEHLSNLCIKEECKQCPSCKTNIQKYEGCNKIVCTKCKELFCWLCFEILDKTRPYKHFGSSNCRLFAVPGKTES